MVRGKIVIRKYILEKWCGIKLIKVELKFIEKVVVKNDQKVALKMSFIDDENGWLKIDENRPQNDPL
jgi:hypothetical protein